MTTQRFRDHRPRPTRSGIEPYVQPPARPPVPERRVATPFEPPQGAQQWNDWARASLFERRMVLLDRPLDDDMATRVASELMLLEGAADDPIDLRIDSTGGTASAALVLIDVIDLLAVPVHARCIGRADGPSVAVLAVADARSAAPHAVLRFGADGDAFEGDATAVARFAEHHRSQVRQLARRVAAATSFEPATVEDMVERRTRVSVEDAVAHELIDEIAEREARVVRFPRRVGFHSS